MVLMELHTRTRESVAFVMGPCTNPMSAPYSTSDKTSFAHTSAKDRWPVILTGAIDDVHRAIVESRDPNNEEVKEGKTILAGLAKLKYELQHDRQLLYIS